VVLLPWLPLPPLKQRLLLLLLLLLVLPLLQMLLVLMPTRAWRELVVVPRRANADGKEQGGQESGREDGQGCTCTCACACT
jgi:hypothetical protein